MPKYLYSHLIFPSQENYPLRSALTNKTNFIPSRIRTFQKNFFPYCIFEWNKLNAEVKNAKFSIYDALGVKLLTRLRLQFSHLNRHKFRHGSGDAVSRMCECNAEIEDTQHFLLRCHFYSIQRFQLFSDINKVEPSFTQLDIKE